jgi:hypothetical protein
MRRQFIMHRRSTMPHALATTGRRRVIMDTTANVMGAGIATVMGFPTTGIVTVTATACAIVEIVSRITRIDTKQVIDASYTPLRRGFLLGRGRIVIETVGELG